MRTPSRLDLLCIALMSTACFSVSGCDDGSTIDGELVLVTPEAPRDLRVLSIRPEEGALTGGTLVVMTGEGFHKDMVVTFGGVEATQLFVGGD
ncbi:MAG TPA: IPT/TIG domain-containing protein, partial [Myxococcota bacterium]|nr:IPT/TIG domain-containing protein [Myxococcota bacterium]